MEKSNFTRQFEDFGIKMYVLAILSIISIFTGSFIQLVMFIIMLLSLKDIKDANRELGNENLEKFRKYIIYAVVVGIVGALIILIVAAIVAFLFISALPGFTFSHPITVSEFQDVAPLINILLIILLAGGLPVGVVALGLLMIAWEEFHIFLERNSGLFPNTVAEKAMEGSGKIKRSYLYLIITLIIGAVLVLVAIIIFPQIKTLIINFIEETTPSMESIAIIPIFAIPGIVIAVLGIISFILMIIGYFKLAELKHL